jgi:ATP-dependent DNA helicase PIF1
MIDGRLFDRIDRTGQAIRGNSRPFGGLQIIACGDFLQLSPVGELNAAGQKDPICTFNSKVWPRLCPRPQDQFNLEQNYRQEDIPFGRLLERMRRGYLMKEDHDVLKGLGRELENDVVDAVHL